MKKVKFGKKQFVVMTEEERQAWMDLNDAIGNAIYKIRDI